MLSVVLVLRRKVVFLALLLADAMKQLRQQRPKDKEGDHPKEPDENQFDYHTY